ncbi:MAG: hypothetical protein ACI30S_03090 [Muribaculaceae bacterium]
MATTYKNRQWLQRFLATFFIMLLACYYSSSTLFLHSHNYDNCIVWHSHPFSNAPHSEQTAVSIASLNTFNVITTDTAEYISPFLCLIQELEEEAIAFTHQKHFSFTSLRAPPAI